MSEQEDKGELKDRDYLKEVADWMDRMPCDWRVCQESLSRSIDGMCNLKADAKVMYVNLLTMVQLTMAQIIDEEKDVNLDELCSMAEAMAADIMEKDSMKAAVLQQQADVMAKIAGGMPFFQGRPR